MENMVLSFNGFLTEAKNLHLEHLEDEVLNNGVVGTRGAINFLQSLRDMLAGNSKSSVETLRFQHLGDAKLPSHLNTRLNYFNGVSKVNYNDRRVSCESHTFQK